MKSACTHCFSGLGVQSRMDIYQYLRHKGSATVNELVELVHLTQPTVSYHLKEMKESGLLTSIKKGKEVYYEINPLCPIYKHECVLNNVKFDYA